MSLKLANPRASPAPPAVVSCRWPCPCRSGSASFKGEVEEPVVLKDITVPKVVTLDSDTSTMCVMCQEMSSEVVFEPCHHCVYVCLALKQCAEVLPRLPHKNQRPASTNDDTNRTTPHLQLLFLHVNQKKIHHLPCCIAVFICLQSQPKRIADDYQL